MARRKTRRSFYFFADFFAPSRFRGLLNLLIDRLPWRIADQLNGVAEGIVNVNPGRAVAMFVDRHARRLGSGGELLLGDTDRNMWRMLRRRHQRQLLPADIQERPRLVLIQHRRAKL